MATVFRIGRTLAMVAVDPWAVGPSAMSYESIYEAVYDIYTLPDLDTALPADGAEEGINIAEASIGRHGDAERTALRVSDFETGAIERHSFGDLNAGANRFANYNDDRIDPRDRVAVMAEPRFELYAALFGVIKAGRVYVRLAPLFGPDAANYRLQDSGTTLLVTESEHLEKIDPEVVPSLEEIIVIDETDVDRRKEVPVVPYRRVAKRADAFSAVRMHPDDMYVLSYTSGTTGNPKGSPSVHALSQNPTPRWSTWSICGGSTATSWRPRRPDPTGSCWVRSCRGFEGLRSGVIAGSSTRAA